MATGSRKWFEYTADDGQRYGMELDESTYTVAGLGFGAQVDVDAPEYAGILSSSATRPLSPRYFNMKGTDSDGRTVTRRVLVGDNESSAWVNPQGFTTTLLTVVNGTATPTVFRVSSAIGEQRQFIPNQDTGLIDGDIDNNLVAPAA